MDRPPAATTTRFGEREALVSATGDDGDDYRHRMLVNALAFVVCVFLIVAGVWLATKMAQMRKDQDCVLSGRRGCTPVEVPVHSRWN